MSLKKLSRNNSEAEVKDLGMSGAALSTQDTVGDEKVEEQNISP